MPPFDAVKGAEPTYVVLGEILMFEALTAPDPMSTDEPLLITTRSAAAVRVLVVVLLIGPLVRSSMLPDVVCRFPLITICDVFVDDPIVIELGFCMKECAEEKVNHPVSLIPFSSVLLTGSILIAPATLKFTAKFVPMRSA
jgi:hypothetical protein